VGLLPKGLQYPPLPAFTLSASFARLLRCCHVFSVEPEKNSFSAPPAAESICMEVSPDAFKVLLSYRL